MLKRFFIVLKDWQKHLQKYTWWELTIFFVGVMSTLAILVTLLLPVGKHPPAFHATGDMLAVSDPAFPDTLSAALSLPLRDGESVQVLNNGNEFLPALLADIDGATSSINIMVYIWSDGEMSDQVFEHLQAKLKQGVSVRILVDGFGAKNATRHKEFKQFKESGGVVAVYRSLSIIPWNIMDNHRRDHRRAIVIDGKIGYVGGMAVADEWLGDARSTEEWRDMMFRVSAPMALDAQESFAQLWANTTGEFLAGDRFYPPTASKGSTRYIPLSSMPSPDNLTLERFFLLSLMGAQDTIYITNPYFLPAKDFRDILESKAQAGVDVRVLVPNKYNDATGVRYASQELYEDLLEKGVKIYEYQPTFIHAKGVVIDNIWSIIGSANLDNRSREINAENIYGVQDAVLGNTLSNTFQNDLLQAREITLEEWRKRGVWQRLREIFALKFVEQY